MIHKPTERFTKKRTLVYAGTILVFAAAVSSIFVLGPIVGIILTVLIGFVGYQLFRLMKVQAESYLKTDEEGMVCKTALGEEIEIAWSEVDQAGLAVDDRGRRFAFVYRDLDDTLITLPDDYSDFDALVAELESRYSLRRFELEPKQSVEEYLKSERAAIDEETGQQSELPAAERPDDPSGDDRSV